MSTFVYTRYPDNYDTPGIVSDTKGLPVIVDLQTPVRAEVVNRHREAILAIEGELGLQPSGTYDTVRARLDALEVILNSITGEISGGIHPVNVLFNGSTVVSNISNLNFIGTGVNVTDTGSNSATISIIGGTGTGTGDGYAPINERLTVSYNGQSVFLLNRIPWNNIVMFFIGGIKQEATDYSVFNNQITWSGSETLLTSDVIEVVYYTDGQSSFSTASNTTMHQESFIATAGQSVFVLSNLPISEQSTEFFINGISQTVGTDYTVLNNVVTYIGDVSIEAGNEISIKYFEFISYSAIEIEKDGVQYSVNKIICGNDVDLSVSGNEATIRARVSGLFGDFGVAKRLLQDSILTEACSIYMLGDSRLYALTPQTLTAYAPGVPWSYGFIGANTQTNVAWTRTVYNPLPRTPVSTPWGNLGQISPVGLISFTMNGTSIPGGNDIVNMAAYYGTAFTMLTEPYKTQQISGHTVTVSWILLTGPHGITTDDIFISLRQDPSTNYNSTYRSVSTNNYSPTLGYKIITATIPNTHNWTLHPEMGIALCMDQGATTTNGQILTAILNPFVTSDVGVATINCSQGGRWTEDYLNDDLFNTDHFNNTLSLLPGRKVLWMDLGTNGTGPSFVTVAQDYNYKVQIINAFRAAEPDGDVIITTAYPSQNQHQSYSTWYREADILLARNLPNVLVVDSQYEMPTFEELNGTYMTDGVHLTTEGVRMWAHLLSSLLKKSAGLY